MGFMAAPAQGGEFKVFCKYNAKAGRWYTKDDEQGAEEYEVTNMTAVFDFPNIKTGWFLYAAGMAPVKHLDPSLAEAAPNPGDNAKRGFELMVYSEKNLGGVREFSSTAGAVIEAMNTLYDQYQAAPEAAQGKLPVVKCVKVEPKVGKHGTNYAPVFEIVQWVARPAALGEVSKPVTPAPAAAPKANNTVPPPAAKAPEPATADDVDF